MSEALSISHSRARQAVLAASHEETLAETFDRWFTVSAADTPELLEKAFRLRYQVYCVENNFEDPAANPEGLERDEFDRRSVHSVLIHRPSKQVAGSVRLVLPEVSSTEPLLPIYQACNHATLHNRSILPLATTAEISRFAVTKSFRRRREDGSYPNVSVAQSRQHMMEERRILPHMTLGLMNAIVRMSVTCGITHWTAVMEPALLRLLSRLGIRFLPLGPIVHHHGRRQPVFAEADELLSGIWQNRPDVWEVITERGALWPLDRCASD